MLFFMFFYVVKCSVVRNLKHIKSIKGIHTHSFKGLVDLLIYIVIQFIIMTPKVWWYEKDELKL